MSRRLLAGSVPFEQIGGVKRHFQIGQTVGLREPTIFVDLQAKALQY